MEDKSLGLLGLMRRAGALEIGEDNSALTVKSGKAKLLLLSSDVSESARRKAEGFCYGRSVQIVSLDITREAMGAAIGLRTCSMLAVTDIGFANALMKELAKQQPEKYGSVYEETQQRLEKTQRRRKETAARGGSKRNVKRRSEV